MSNASNYDRIAPFYDQLVRMVFGNQLLEAECYFLNNLPSPRKILIFGGGTGRSLRFVLQKYPDSSICFLEASSAMISKAQKRQVPGINRVHFIHGDEQRLAEMGNNFDAVVTPFVLDVFTADNFKYTIDQLFQVLTKGGYWIQTDFYVYRNNPWWQRFLVWLMYRFFKIAANQENLQLPDFNGQFARLSLARVDEKDFCSGMVRTVLYRKLQDTEPSH